MPFTSIHFDDFISIWLYTAWLVWYDAKPLNPHLVSHLTREVRENFFRLCLKGKEVQMLSVLLMLGLFLFCGEMIWGRGGGRGVKRSHTVLPFHVCCAARIFSINTALFKRSEVTPNLRLRGFVAQLPASIRLLTKLIKVSHDAFKSSRRHGCERNKWWNIQCKIRFNFVTIQV